MTTLSSMQYPHWLMTVGALLLVLGFVGLALHQRGVVIESHAAASEQEPLESEADLDQVEVYNRMAKAKRRERWAERLDDPDKQLDASPEI